MCLTRPTATDPSACDSCVLMEGSLVHSPHIRVMLSAMIIFVQINWQQSFLTGKKTRNSVDKEKYLTVARRFCAIIH